MKYFFVCLIIYCSLIFIFSLISIIAYANDKKKAIKGMERTKEKDLLFLAVFFGALGSVIGRIISHHKTDKAYFSIVIYFSLLLQIATFLFIGYLYLS